MGQNRRPQADFLDSEEISEAFDSLSPENRLKLYEIERISLRGTDLSPGDLLHEALCAAIMGDRKCPRDVPFMAFIIQTMRSIASHHREKRRREPADGGAAQEAAETPAVVFSAAASDPEQILIERESEDTVVAIHDCFEGDEQAQMVVLGWSEGYRGKELRDFVGVDQAALDYAIKRIRRTMTKRYPQRMEEAMTSPRKNPARDQLDRIEDALIEVDSERSEAELRDDMAERGEDPDKCLAASSSS